MAYLEIELAHLSHSYRVAILIGFYKDCKTAIHRKEMLCTAKGSKTYFKIIIYQ
jgi:hypothetical protein